MKSAAPTTYLRNTGAVVQPDGWHRFHGADHFSCYQLDWCGNTVVRGHSQTKPFARDKETFRSFIIGCRTDDVLGS